MSRSVLKTFADADGLSLCCTPLNSYHNWLGKTQILMPVMSGICEVLRTHASPQPGKFALFISLLSKIVLVLMFTY